MARSRSLNLRRPEARETVDRVYAVNRHSPTGGRCMLDDGSIVLCAFETAQMAIRATSKDPGLQLVRHQALSSKEQARVQTALLA